MMEQGAEARNSTAWAHRSYPSVESIASQRSSHAPISWNPQNSGESYRTFDSFEDSDGAELSETIRKYCALHPYKEQDSALPVEAVSALPTSPIEATSSATMEASQTDHLSLRSIDDPEELERWTHEMRQNSPPYGLPAMEKQPMPAMESPAMFGGAAECRADALLGVVTYVEMCRAYVHSQMTEAQLQSLWAQLPRLAAPQGWLMVTGSPVIVIDPTTPVDYPAAATAACAAAMSACGGHESLSFQASNPAKQRQRSRSPSRKQARGHPKERTMDNADEEPSSTKKRKESVSNLKDLEAYKKNQNISKSRRPKTPDPYNTTLSKRQWERQMAACRGEWRGIHGVQQLVDMGFGMPSAEAAWAAAIGVPRLPEVQSAEVPFEVQNAEDLKIATEILLQQQ